MEVNEINFHYQTYLGTLNRLKPKVSKLSDELENESIKIEEAKLAIKRFNIQLKNPKLNQAQKDKLNQDITAQETIIENAKRKIEEINKKLEEPKKELQLAQQKVNEYIQEAMRDPEVALLIQGNIQAKREKIAKSKKIKDKVKERESKNKEKENLTQCKDKLPKIQDLINNNPVAKKALEEVLKIRKDYNETKEKYDQETDPSVKSTLAARLYQLDQDMREPKGKLDTEANNKGFAVTDKDLDEIIKSGLVLDRKGKLNFKATFKDYDKYLTKEINARNKEIIALDKAIAPYKDILDREGAPGGGPTTGGAPTTDSEEKTGFFKGIGNWFKKILGIESEPTALPAGPTSGPAATTPAISEDRAKLLKNLKVIQAVEKTEWDKMVQSAEQQVENSTRTTTNDGSR